MTLLFDDDLTEAAVFLAARGGWTAIPSLQVRRFHAERERLYRLLDPDERSDAFARLHLTWFREWGFESYLADSVADYPCLATSLSGLGFRKARRGNEEGAELFVNAEHGRHAIVAMRSDRFSNRAATTEFLRHELMHVRDMVAKEFGYSPVLQLTVASSEKLVRERYRVLWDVTIDGRLARAGKGTVTPAKRFAEFSNTYRFWSAERQREVFDQLWNVIEPRHEELLHLASDPRDLAHSLQPLPGAQCPLCQFPTFSWAVPAAAIAEMVRAEFPSWEMPHGMCARCHEMYEARLNVSFQ